MSGAVRLLIIGIDGADYEFITRWLDRGHLPHMSELLSHGQLLKCHSTLPAYERRPWWETPRVCPSLWRRLSDAGLSSGSLNVPMTYPAEAVNGVVVSGVGSPALSEAAFYPRSLREELSEAIPDYDLQPALEPGMYPPAETFIEYDTMRERASRFLLDRQQFDVFMVVFNGLDWAGHGYPCQDNDDEGVCLEVMQSIDEHLGSIVERSDWPKTPVLLVSDHGMHRTTRQVNLEKLFIKLGIMRVRSERGAGLVGASGGLVIRAWYLAKRVLPSSALAWLRRAVNRPRKAVVRAMPSISVDWEHTIAVPVGPVGAVKLNLRGREPQGSVSPEDYEAVRRDVIQRLREAKDPASGAPLFSQVASRDDVYSGPLIGGAPDIVLVPGPGDLGFGAATTQKDLSICVRQPDLFGAPGECSLADLAPTVLHLLGLPAPSYMDGQVLIDHLSGEPAKRPVEIVEEELPEPESREAETTEEQETQLTEKLRGLGYI